jgi:hypothetical protein
MEHRVSAILTSDARTGGLAGASYSARSSIRKDLPAELLPGKTPTGEEVVVLRPYKR